MNALRAHHPFRHVATLAAVLGAFAVGASGCSNSSSSSTSTSPSTTGISGLPATGSVDGYTLAATSTPRQGKVGNTTIRVVAVLKGTVPAGHVEFQISNAPNATVGRPSTDQKVTVHGPGTYAMPSSYVPKVAGSWAVTVIVVPQDSTKSKLSVSGQPPVSGTSAPFPQLVTKVTAN